jgi:hypothetical protein
MLPYEYLIDADRCLSFSEDKKNFTRNPWQLGLRFEAMHNTRGYPVDTTDSLVSSYNARSVKASVPSYLALYESALAPFFGGKTKDSHGQFVQQLTPYGGATTSQVVSFNGSLSIFSCVGLAEYWLFENCKIGYYLPYYSLNFSSLEHTLPQKKKTFENAIIPDVYASYIAKSTFIHPYTLAGVGDSELLLSWQRYFYENRDFITGIFASLRGGLYLPTARQRESYVNTFLKLPLGYDMAWGIPFGGSIEIDISLYGGAGINADCITFFSKYMDRYVRTDMRQTDMLSIDSVPSLLKPGFKESFSVYGLLHDLNKTTLFTLAYQYNKQNESEILLCDNSYTNIIAQSGDLLESWTNHNLLFILEGETKMFFEAPLSYSLFYKWGISGLRSVVGNSFGLQAMYSF